MISLEQGASTKGQTLCTNILTDCVLLRQPVRLGCGDEVLPDQMEWCAVVITRKLEFNGVHRPPHATTLYLCACAANVYIKERKNTDILGRIV